jgi:zinc finger protein
MSSTSEPVFRKVGDENIGITSVESLCMKCEKHGTTQLLLTSIPHFREVVLMSFHCPHCGFKNSEIQPAAHVQDRGCRITLKVFDKEDLNRQVVRSEWGTFRVEDLDLEFPPSGNGRLTTIEGMLHGALEELKESWREMRETNPDMATKLEGFLGRLTLCAAGLALPFVVTLDDPSGNSFIENTQAPNPDPLMKIENYVRSAEQNKALQLMEQPTEENDGSKPFVPPAGAKIRDVESKEEKVTMMSEEKEVYAIPADCPNCHAPGKSEMCMIDVPFFKEVLIMAFVCQKCGFRNNEVKGGGPISNVGHRLTLSIPSKKEDPEAFQLDMSRDVVKSTTSGLLIPELELEVTPGSLGGMYTTVEGLLTTARDRLMEGDLASLSGDSATPERISKFDEFERKFDQLLNGERPFTFVLDDPLANSYIYSPTAPEPEPRLKTEEYTRTEEQNEEFGLNDMKTEDYEKRDIDLEKFGMRKSDREFKEAHAKMRDLQVEGKETHPNAEVIGQPAI